MGRFYITNGYNKRYIKKITVFIIVMFCFLSGEFLAVTVSGQESIFTPDESAYISQKNVIKAATVDGVAPFAYIGKNGEIKGVFHSVLNRISEISGLNFECKIYSSLDEMFKSDADIIYGIPKTLAPDDMPLSNPFLETEMILYMNSSVRSDNLKNRIFAAVRGAEMPRGIKVGKTIYFNRREDSIKAVEKGKADFGYGNAYSVAYYTLKYGYKNIVTVPLGNETRMYCIGFLKRDDMLLSIIDKSLGLIDDREMRKIILNASTDVERVITIDMILDSYGTVIMLVFFAISIILLICFFAYIQISRRLREQNKKYEILSHISNEYIYEYYVKEKRLKLYDKFYERFNNEMVIEKVREILINTLANHQVDWPDNIIRLPLPEGGTGFFKATNSYLCDNFGKAECIIGKLIDVSEEVAEKEELIIKSQRDELTGLYNAATAKELINKRIAGKKDYTADALLLIDCDSFKNINDTRGHLAGDKVLEKIAEQMKQNYRSSDILGRIGGDEFCVYMKDVPSIDFVYEKAQNLSRRIQNVIDESSFSVSIGIVMVREKESYEAIFQKADKALYKAKNKGKAQVQVWDRD